MTSHPFAASPLSRTPRPAATRGAAAPARTSGPPRRRRRSGWRPWRRHSRREDPAPKPRFLVVGDVPFAADIVERCSLRLGPGALVPGLEGALAEIDRSTLAVIFAIDPEDYRALARLFEATREPAFALVHRFAVLARPLPSAPTDRLLRCPLTAVFEWPRERGMLPDLLLELLTSESPRDGRADGHRMLGRAVRARLKLLTERDESVRAHARAGIVMLRGVVASPARKRFLEEEIRQVPGVRSVVSRRLAVAPLRSGPSDGSGRSLRLFEIGAPPDPDDGEPA